MDYLIQEIRARGKSDVGRELDLKPSSFNAILKKRLGFESTKELNNYIINY